MSDKELEITITAKGADKAKAELDGVASAAKRAADAAEVDGPTTSGDAGVKQAEEKEDSSQTVADRYRKRAAAIEELRSKASSGEKAVEGLNKETEKIGTLKLSKEDWEGWGEGIKELSGYVKEFSAEFANTEKGQAAIAKLDEGWAVVGTTMASTIGSAASALATGGPLAGGLALVTSLAKTLADEWLDAQKRIEDANAEYERAEIAHAAARRERARELTLTKIEDQFKRELDVIEDQNDALERQNGIRDAKRDLADEEFALEQEKARGAGVSEEELKLREIAYRANADKESAGDGVAAAAAAYSNANLDLAAKKRKLDELRNARVVVNGQESRIGTNSEEYKKAAADVAAAEEVEAKRLADLEAERVEAQHRYDKIDKRSERQRLEVANRYGKRNDKDNSEKDLDFIRGGGGSKLAESVGAQPQEVAALGAIEKKLRAGKADPQALAQYEKVLEALLAYLEDQGASANAKRVSDLESRVEKLAAAAKRKGDAK